MVLVCVRRNRNGVIVSDIAKSIDTTYAHACKTVNKLEDKNMLESERNGRKKIVTLSDKGKEYAELFNRLVNMRSGLDHVQPA